MRGIDHVMRTIAPPIVALILLFAAGCGEAGPKTEEIVLPALHIPGGSLQARPAVPKSGQARADRNVCPTMVRNAG